MIIEQPKIVRALRLIKSRLIENEKKAFVQIDVSSSVTSK
jgi:hypothetical protein